MEYRILGPLEVVRDGHALDLGGQKQRALLALLLLEANRVVSRDRLIDAIWEEDPPATARKALQVYISQLRKLLGTEHVETRAPGYLLRVAPGELDLARFRALQEEGMLREALSLWRGAPLADLAGERFAQAEIVGLQELRLGCLEDRIEQDIARGQHAAAVSDLERLVTEHPLRERLRGQLMLCLYRGGRQAQALDVYRAGRAALVEELGIEPGRELRELHEAILRQEPGLDLADTSELATEAPRSAFVGRDHELSELTAGLEDAFAGRGRLFLLGGEPGIGKSRLAEELAARAGARGARVLVGRCWEAGGAPAYWPWVQSLRVHARQSDSDALRSQLGAGAAELAQILPELRERFPDLPEPPSRDSEAARFSLFDATATFLRNAAQRRPIVLVLDDLHAADAPSLLLLRFVVRELGSTGVLLIGAYRDIDPLPGGPLTEMLADVTREPVTQRLALRGLNERDIAGYVDLTAAQIASPQLVAALHEETEGNPLFVGEIVRLLAIEGVRPGGGLAIPQSVRDVIARRLDHLSQSCNGVLLHAAVIGREFALDGVGRVAGVTQDELLDALDEAMTAGVVSDIPGGDGRLRFAHVLIRDTLYEGLTTARRVGLHRLVVEALEALYGGDEPGAHLAELAHHAKAAMDFERVVQYARRAGDRGLELLAYEESARLYDTALDALGRMDVPEEESRCELLLSLGEARARAGDLAAAKQAFLDAASSARRLGLPRALARAAAGYGGRMAWGRAGDDSRLIPLLEEGLTALPEEDVELRARLLARLAGALRDEPDPERRHALSSEAVRLARQAGKPRTLGYALDGRAAAIIAPDAVTDCLALADELGEVAELSGDAELAVAGHLWRIMAQLQIGDVEAAEAEAAVAATIADELGQPNRLWEVCSCRAMLALATGRLDEAEDLIAQGFALGERAQPQGAIPIDRVHRYTLRDFRGGLEEMEAEIRGLAADYPARPVLRCVLADLLARVGRSAEAQHVLDELGRDGFAALPFDQEWLFGVSLLAETAVVLQDDAAAAVLDELLAPWDQFNVSDAGEGIRGAVSRYLGLLAAMSRDWERAERQFEHAIAMNTRMGLRPWLAHTQRDLARMLLARAAPGDNGRASELLGAASDTYRHLGMDGHAALARELASTV
jgi:DNA-binding SARP family transcriptional activator